jgi:hypothetical protein
MVQSQCPTFFFFFWHTLVVAEHHLSHFSCLFFDSPSPIQYMQGSVHGTLLPAGLWLCPSLKLTTQPSSPSATGQRLPVSSQQVILILKGTVTTFRNLLKWYYYFFNLNSTFQFVQFVQDFLYLSSFILKITTSSVNTSHTFPWYRLRTFMIRQANPANISHASRHECA